MTPSAAPEPVPFALQSTAVTPAAEFRVPTHLVRHAEVDAVPFAPQPITATPAAEVKLLPDFTPAVEAEPVAFAFPTTLVLC